MNLDSQTLYELSNYGAADIELAVDELLKKISDLQRPELRDALTHVTRDMFSNVVKHWQKLLFDISIMDVESLPIMEEGLKILYLQN